MWIKVHGERLKIVSLRVLWIVPKREDSPLLGGSTPIYKDGWKHYWDGTAHY